MKKIMAVIFVCSAIFMACGDGGEITTPIPESPAVSRLPSPEIIENIQTSFISPGLADAIKTCGPALIKCRLTPDTIDAMRMLATQSDYLYMQEKEEKETPATMVNNVMLFKPNMGTSLLKKETSLP